MRYYTKRVAFRITPETEKDLDKVAKQRKVRVTDFAREAIEKAVKRALK